jgi:hypothetical protein
MVDKEILSSPLLSSPLLSSSPLSFLHHRNFFL